MLVSSHRKWLPVAFALFALPALAQIDSLKITQRPEHTIVYVNDYSNVLSFDSCQNTMHLSNPADFAKGEMIMIIQMQGALIDSSNTPAFGDILDYRHTGNFEFNFIERKSGNEILLRNFVSRKYDVQNGKVQIVGIHPFTNYTVADPVSCPPWNGSTGGVVVLFVQDTLTLNQPITTEVSGFRGGVTANFQYNTMACGQTAYSADSASWQYARKGEGIALLGFDKWNGRGKFANGGGGGNAQNSGGGGGGNFGQGGQGGYQLDSCASSPFNNGGIAGTSLNYSTSINQIFMGGGGGAGHMDSNNPAFDASGGTGGGIIIIKAGYLRSGTYQITANGTPGKYCYSCTNDGTGGGGAGGTILLDVGTYLDSATITARGGDGSWVLNYASPTQRVGPGGGGAGGVIWFKGNIPATARTSVTGGANGIIYDDAQNPWGAIQGSNGAVLNNLQMPFDTVPFTQPFAIINAAVSNCNTYTFNGIITPAFLPVSSWLWNFGDAITSAVQNPVHTYSASATFRVNLTVTAANGCIIDTGKGIMVPHFPTVTAAKSNDIDCFNGSVKLSATGATRYVWQPASTLNNPAVPDPIASPTQQTTYKVTGWDTSGGCSSSDSVVVKISLADAPIFLMPSAFTPNNDGNNECFGIKGWGAIEQLEFTIYNRWGQPVFHTRTPLDCWNGTFKREPVPAGVYIYMIRAKTLCGMVQRNGSVVLIR